MWIDLQVAVIILLALGVCISSFVGVRQARRALRGYRKGDNVG